MKKETMSRILCAILMMHIVVCYVISWSFGGFYSLSIYPFIIIPIGILLAISMYRLEQVWIDNLQDFIKLTQSIWSWVFFMGGFGIIIGCGYFASKLLVSLRLENIIWFVICIIIYLLYICGIKKNLQKQFTKQTM